MILSRNGQLRTDIPLKPSFFFPNHLQTMVSEVQSQIDRLIDDRQIELSLATLCVSKMPIALATLALQLRLQFHLRLALLHCVTQSLWIPSIPTGTLAEKILGAILLIPSRVDAKCLFSFVFKSTQGTRQLILPNSSPPRKFVGPLAKP